MRLATRQNVANASSAFGAAQRRRDIALPLSAGIAYTLVWIIGLVIWPSNLDVNSSGAAVIAAYQGHQAVALIQFALVEGLAALALGVVVLAVGQTARQRGASGLARATVTFGMGAAVVSLIQCALGEALVGWVAPSGNTGLSVALFDLISRLDGVKMLALACMALIGVGLARRGALPRWLGYEGVALALALIASGIGYLLLTSPLSLAAAVSLPLLLIWVTGAGVALAWRGGRRTQVDSNRVDR